MYEDLEVRHAPGLLPSQPLMKVGDALPGLGIVAAVLGVVITMQAIGGPVEEIGHKVGAALVGTFLGILLSYGFAQPVATMHGAPRDGGARHRARASRRGSSRFTRGSRRRSPIEFARRVVPEDVRPTFEETEKLCRGARSDATAQAAAA